MRLFVAVELGEGVRREAARVASDLASALEEGAGRGRASWVATGNLHLTLQFLGEVDASLSKTVVERLTPPMASPAFDVAIGGVGVFPPSGPPRVIWLGVTEGGAPLSTLHREVGRRLDGLGFPPDERPFSAHLTLGRLKASPGPRVRDILAGARVPAVGRCRVDRVALFESRISSKGATYVVVATAQLGDHQS